MQDSHSDKNNIQNPPAAKVLAPRSVESVEYAQLLRRVDLFADVDRVALAKLAAHLQPLRYRASSIIFSQGEMGDAFYLVAGGSVGVYLSDRSEVGQIPVQILQAGEPFGEMALLTNSPRTATIKAETDCEVLRLERSAFLNLVRDQPGVALAIAATLSRRLARMLTQAVRTDTAGTAIVAKPSDEGVVGTASGNVPLRRWRPTRANISLAAAGLILGIGLMLPPLTGQSVVAWHALVILFAALPILIFESIPEGILGLLLACAWVLLGVSSVTDALGGFATTSWVLVVAVLIIGAAITETGILYRLALQTITHLRGGFAGEVCSLSLAGLLISPAVPVATGRIIIIAPMLKELVEALGYGARSRASAGLAMAALIGFGQMAAAFLTSSATAVLVSALLPAEAHPEMNWINWAIYGAPVNIILFVGILVSIVWLYRPAAEDRRGSAERAKSLQLQKALLGPMTRAEKIALGAGIGLLLSFATQPLHGVNPAWVAILAIGVLSATRVVTTTTLRAVNWNFALLFGILISLAAVFERTGLDRWIADGVVAAVGDLSSARVSFVIVLALFCFAISFVVRWQAAAPLITIALGPVASAAGISPFVVGLIAVIACNGFFLPYQSTTYLALYAGSGGQLFSHAQALPAALAFGVWTVVAVALSVPVWRLMGLM